MRMNLSAFVALVIVGVVIAVPVGCAGKASAIDADGGTDGSTPPVDGAVIPPGDPSCPATVPANGSSCKPVASCTYISGPHGSCTVTASCSAPGTGGPFTWNVSKPGTSCGGNKPECPASYTSLAVNAPCPGARDLLCDYADGRCGCQACTPDGGSAQSASEWTCRKWTDVPAGCPTDVPTIGGPCTMAGLNCNYAQLCGGISFGGSLSCNGTTWTQGPVVAGACAQRACGS